MVFIFVVFVLNFVLVCFLDEVDVLLDDLNVEWFCNLFYEMKKIIDICFFVIIYNVLSMVNMDCFYGVIMVECGVS